MEQLYLPFWMLYAWGQLVIYLRTTWWTAHILSELDAWAIQLTDKDGIYILSFMCSSGAGRGFLYYWPILSLHHGRMRRNLIVQCWPFVLIFLEYRPCHLICYNMQENKQMTGKVVQSHLICYNMQENKQMTGKVVQSYLQCIYVNTHAWHSAITH